MTRPCRERITQNRQAEPGKPINKGQQKTMARSFADAKWHHGHRYVRYRSLDKAHIQGLAAASQNMKKIALVQSRKGCKVRIRPPHQRGCLIRSRDHGCLSWRRWLAGPLVSQ
ncbi:transposase [Aeromonas sp. 164P]